MTRRMKCSISGLVMVLMAVLFGACAEPTTKPTPSVEAWMEDAVPYGGTVSTYGGTWSFVSSNPTPNTGALALKSALVSGQNQYAFIGATATLQVNPGDVLYCWVYLDPTNPPQEIMLQWHTTDSTNWNHRAYWGANLIGHLGTDGTGNRRFRGPLPPTGQWVRLEVPASLVDMEGLAANGMAFDLYDGVCTFDQAGKYPGR